MNNSKNIFFRTQNIVVIYTALRILLAMQKQLGLEAMLEYRGQYLRAIESSNPLLKHAVTRALSLIDVEKIYREAFLNET